MKEYEIIKQEQIRRLEEKLGIKIDIEVEPDIEEFNEALKESVAETSEEMMDKFLGTTRRRQKELLKLLKDARRGK